MFKLKMNCFKITGNYRELHFSVKIFIQMFFRIRLNDCKKNDYFFAVRLIAGDLRFGALFAPRFGATFFGDADVLFFGADFAPRFGVTFFGDVDLLLFGELSADSADSTGLSNSLV